MDIDVIRYASHHMGNDDAYDYWDYFVSACEDNLSEEEIMLYGNIEKIPLEKRKDVICRCLNLLIGIVREDPSIDGYLALGVFLTQNGAVVSDEIKQLILDHVIDEEDRFFGVEEWSQRKPYLDDFREKIKNYENNPITFESEDLLEKIAKHVQDLTK